MSDIKNNDTRIRKQSDIQLYKECPACQAWAFNQSDAFCSKCGSKLDDVWLASISSYAKTLLIEFLKNCPEIALEADISEVPDYASENIRANGCILFNQYATRRVLAECWNEVEIALDDWKENYGTDYPVSNIEQLHVFCVVRHADKIWRSITDDILEDRLRKKSLSEAIYRLEHW